MSAAINAEAGMRADEVISKVLARPFVSVRLVMTAGTAVDVVRSDLVLVGAQFVIVGTPCVDNPTLVERADRVHFSQVVGMQDILDEPARA